MKRCSQVARNKRALLKSLPAPTGLKLHDFLAKRGKDKGPPVTVNLKVGKPVSYIKESWEVINLKRQQSTICIRQL